jgi:hypothetical protein
LAALPLLGLFVLWHGPLPPSFQKTHEAEQWLNARALGFCLAVLGLYAWPLLFTQVQRQWASLWRLLIAAAAGAVWLCMAPLIPSATDDGFLWRLASATPTIMGSSLLFWVLVPSGVAALVHLVQQGHARLVLWALLAFGVTLLHSGILFQKYFDPFIPLLLILSREPGRTEGLWLDRCAWGALACFGLLYAWLPYLRAASAP